MERKELLKQLEFEYWGIVKANPDWDVSLWDFLISKGFTAGEIYDYNEDIYCPATHTSYIP